LGYRARVSSRGRFSAYTLTIALVAGTLQAVLAPSAQAATGDLTPLECLANQGAAGCADLLKDSLAGASSTVVSPDSKHVYVGSSASVTAFQRDLNTGTLTQAGCWSNTGADGCDALASPVLSSVANLAMSADGKNLYATNLQGASVIVFNRDAETGDLTQAACLANSNANGCTALVNPSLSSAYDITVSPNGENVYVASLSSASVTIFDRDTTTGALTESGCLATTNNDGCTAIGGRLTGAWGVAVSGDGQNVYVASQGGNAISVFDRNGTTGALTANGCLANTNADGCTALAKPSLAGARFVAVSPDDKDVYVTAGTGNSVTHFQRDLATGQLTQADCLAVTGADGCTAMSQSSLRFARDVEVSPDGLNLYTTSMARANVTVIDRNVTTGSITQNTCFANTNIDGCTVLARPSLSDAMKLSLSPNGTDIYVGSQISAAVTVFSRAAAPIVVTGPASAVTRTTATVSGEVFANAATTTALDITYGTDQAVVASGGGTAATVTPGSATGLGRTDVTAALTGLSPDTKYYYRLSAANGDGSSEGTVESFTTRVAQIALAPEALSFGDVVVAQASGEQTVTVTSTGSAAVDFPGAAVTLTGADAAQFVIAGDTCSTKTVEVGQTCSISVRFAPTKTGASAAKVSIASTAKGAPQTVDLTGTGTGTPAPLTKQKPVKALNLPAKLKNAGWTRIVKVRVRTNAGQNARVRVTGRPIAPQAAGEVRAFRVVRRNGQILVWLSGAQATKVRVQIQADAVPGYTSYKKVKVYRTRAVR